ncbi:MAG: GAF domain-containing protein [Syntrophobacteraceae bacterium]|jgi:hypothetical protein|nr:GAF domain-containing protein [Syntrophobacteraceae bacterium]
MNTDELQQHCSLDAAQFIVLAEKAMTSESLENFMSFALPWISRFAHSPAAFFYVHPRRDPLDRLHHCGLAPREVELVQKICRAELDRWITSLAPQCSGDEGTPPGIVSDYWLWPMREQRGVVGLLGIVPSARSYHLPSHIWDDLIHFLGHAMGSLMDRASMSRQVAYLNTYLTVSTLLAQSVELQELMETILFFCTDVVLAEEASVLLLDKASASFVFYQTEGASRSVLSGKTFPADAGIAGAVLSSRKSEIINEVQEDSRFYPRFDAESGVQTRNMIAIPLVTGDEPVGVLEVINKAGGLPFTDDDHLLLHFIADEIAFAIRNARLFDYVVKSYCKQKQGLNSCEGCQRPLGSWTPCVKYRQGIS